MHAAAVQGLLACCTPVSLTTLHSFACVATLAADCKLLTMLSNGASVQVLVEVLLAPELDDHYGVPLNLISLAQADVAVAAAVLDTPKITLEMLDDAMVPAQVRHKLCLLRLPASATPAVHVTPWPSVQVTSVFWLVRVSKAESAPMRLCPRKP